MKLQFEFIELSSVRNLIRMNSGSTLKHHETKTNVKYLARKKISILCDSIIIINDIQNMLTTGGGDKTLKLLPKMESCQERAKWPRGERVMDDIANMGYGYEREFCSLSDYTIYSYSRLPVTDLKPSELSEKIHSWSILKSHKTETKAKVKNPARSNLDIISYYHNRQQYSVYQNKWRRRQTLKSLPKMSSCQDRASCGTPGERVMEGIAIMGHDYEKESCSLSNDTIYSLPRLSVTDLQPSELSENMHSGSNLKSHKTETKAKLENPARSN